MRMIHNQKWIALLAAFVFLSGCDQAAKVPDTVTKNSLIIDKDGSVTAHVVDVFDKDYYKLDDLSVMAQKEVSTYNREHPAETNPVSLLKIGTVEDGGSAVIVSYAFQNARTYSEYMGDILFYGTVEEAVNAGYAPAEDQILTAASGDEKLAADQLTDQTGGMLSKHIVLLQGATLVYCPYKVSYISDGAKMMEDGSIDTSGVSEDGYPAVIVLDR
ncbi:MAG: hypothetical protein IJ716_02300 [Lachnospiraceae bacterium]|nr:hypothetical protein [Lachnospiraceae bacterium]